MNLLRLSCRVSKYVAAVLLAVLITEVCAGVLDGGLNIVSRAQAALVTIESAPSIDGPSHTPAGASTVFLDDDIGYKFYRSSTGICRYSKTTNGGSSWSLPVTVDNQTDCIGVVVWYDQWTPGDTSGTYIHIATMDDGADDLYYNRLDTSTDTLLLTTSTSTTLNSTSSYTSATNRVSITKATDGTIYMVADDATGSGTEIRSCAASCNIGSNWTRVGTPPQGNADSWSMVLPDESGDVILINRSTGNLLRYSVWNGVSWSSMINIDPVAIRGGTYDVSMSATVDTDSGDIYLVYVADADNFTTADHDIRTAVYSGGSWTNKTNILTNATTTPGIHQVAIARDQNNGTIYVAYTARTTLGTAASSNAYWVSSSDGMTTWGARQGPINSAAGEFYGIDLNIMSYERIYASWFNATVATVRAIYGDTIADISPEVLVKGVSGQRTPVRAETNNFYLGGAFSVKSLATRTVSTIVVGETGSVDAENELDNITLYYETDTTAPYNCVSESYSGSETQFGSTETDGFSGSDGTASFTNTPVTVSPTETLCIYTVLDVLPSADDGETIELQINNAATDVVVSGAIAYPASVVRVASTTTIIDPKLTQAHYHWRNDDGSETGATSATAGLQDTSLTSLAKQSPRRLRLAVSNEGSTTSLPVSLQLEYGVAAPTCESITSWTPISNTTTWTMYDSTNLTHGSNTTNIATSTGGVTDENSVFLTPNAGVLDTQASTSNVTLATNNFLELEFSLVASSTATEGETYCFRTTRSGTELGNYSVYPQATISSDVVVQATGTQATSTDVGAVGRYYGGAFAVVENTSSRNITSLTFSEEGSVNAQTGLSDISLRYELDTTLPYNCGSVSYDGTETQFGSTQTNFTDLNGTVTFTGIATITTTAAACFYLEYSVTHRAAHNETVNIVLASPATDVGVSGGGSVGPSTKVDVNGTTTLRGGVLSQTHFHWRSNNGTEATASSATNGIEDTPVTDFARETPIRLRLGVANTGPTSSSPTAFRLEYGLKITTCSNVGVWTDVDSISDEWDMYDSVSLTDGDNTTNISTGSGGVSDVGSNFLSVNGGVRDVTSIVPTSTLATDSFVDFEYSLTSTDNTAYETTYCFRVTAGGVSLPVYSQYAELTTAPKRDFKVQRGMVQVTGTSTVITAGIDYVAPASTSTAFIRITNSFQTGAGRDTGGATQNVDDVTAYIANPENLLTNIRFSRPSTAINNTRIYWEIIEFIGESGTDNQMVVRQVGSVSMNTASLTATSTVVAGVSDDADVVVFVTGAQVRNTTSQFYAGQVTSAWSSSTQRAVFTRGATGSSINDVSYAVVEYVGQNWVVQRAEHTYTASGTVETKDITPVNSLSKTFLHVQKRMGLHTNVVHLGHEVWLSSIGSLSFQLEPLASTTGQVAVAWVIENTQGGASAMQVQRSNGNTTGGTAPLTLTVNLSPAIEAANNASIFAVTRAATVGTNHPRAHAGFTINGTSTYTIWRSNTGSLLTYRVEVVEWPVSDIGLRQNRYQFFADNNALTPTDPWPIGVTNLGENAPIGASNEPLSRGDTVRLRTSVKISNATMPAGYRSLKLQFGLRTTGSCSAVSTWNDVGAAASSSAWRGVNATGTTNGTSLGLNPPGVGEVFLSESDVAGVLVHQNPSAANPYPVVEGADVEYDWYLQHNGANPRSVYCFRMVLSDGETLDGYLDYPTIRTAGYTPVSQNWRWYSDYLSETPVIPSAAINVAPIEIANGDTLELRVTVKEMKDVAGTDIRYRLQFSDDAGFANPVDVVATTSCAANSLWCYASGGGVDHAIITTGLLDDSDSCVASVGNGCGRHVTSPTYYTGHMQPESSAQEYSFIVQNKAARVSAVYYFRLYDTANGEVVAAGNGETLPSLVTEGPSLSFAVAGLPAGTSTAGVFTNVAASSTGINFGTLAFNTDYIAGHRISVSTNATEGYQVLAYVRQQLINQYGESILPLTTTNTAPAGWSSVCTGASVGCAGYHTTDATLRGGSTRFAANDTYAGLSTTPVEIMYSSLPADDTNDMVYRVRASQLQPAGDYQTEVVYLAIPTH